jgi:putative tryptophan/tyrosine transport system substrate-binding protein
MKLVKLIVILLTAAVLTIGTARAADTAKGTKSKKVLLAVFFDNPDYDSSRKAFRDELDKQAKLAKMKIDFMLLDTQGSKSLFISQLKKMEPLVDLIFVAGTPNCLAVKEAGITKPVIFTAVADPVGAKLVDNLDTPKTNFTGCHCTVSIRRQLSALTFVIPTVKKIGLFYNPKDQAPASQVVHWKEAIAGLGLQSFEFPIPENANSANALADATRAMVGKVDVIVTTADAKVSAYGEGMVAVANVNKIPTYASLNSLVRKGALMSLGFDFIKGAAVTASQAMEILNGKNPGKVPVVTIPEYKLVVNLNTAKAIDLVIPDSVIKTAAEVIK